MIDRRTLKTANLPRKIVSMSSFHELPFRIPMSRLGFIGIKPWISFSDPFSSQLSVSERPIIVTKFSAAATTNTKISWREL